MLGVCYFPEHWPEQEWPKDAAQMAELGLTYVRIAEFAWSRIEPSRDEFHWDWLDRAIETLGAHGLKIVMCTPTATPPKWLIDEAPEILAWDADGRPRRFGSRKHHCFSSPVWIEETRRICEAVVRRYGGNEHVAGWQTDNEYGCHDTVLSYAPHCVPAFQAWLKDRYGTIEALNEAWGNVFWSMEYNDFSQIDLPNLTVTEANPAHSLDFRRYSSDAVVAYNKLQSDIIREHSPGRFVSHNFMGFFTQFDHHKVSEDLDVATWDSYPLGFTAQRMPLSAGEKARWARTGHPDAAAVHHDLYRGMTKGGRWWVMEQQPGPVNWAPHNPSPAPGMVRLWAWEALAHGSECVSFFRWRQAPFGQEQMHAGLNLPDGRPDVGFHETAEVARELARIHLDDAESTPAPVALVFDYEAAWALSIQPQGDDFDYLALVQLYYTALRRLGVDVDVVRSGADLKSYALVCVPSLPIVSDAALRAFRSSDAVLVLGPRSGSRTVSHRIPETLPPGPLQDLIDLKVTRVESLLPGQSEQLAWNERRYPATRWMEHVDTGLAADAFVGAHGALFRQENVVYQAFWPDEAFLIDYLDSLMTEAGIRTIRLPDALRMRRRGNLQFAFNRASVPIGAPAPAGVTYAIGGDRIEAYGVAAWKVA